MRFPHSVFLSHLPRQNNSHGVFLTILRPILGLNLSNETANAKANNARSYNLSWVLFFFYFTQANELFHGRSTEAGFVGHTWQKCLFPVKFMIVT